MSTITATATTWPPTPAGPSTTSESAAPGFVGDTWNVMVRELRAGVPRAGLGAVRDGAAAGVPRAVRAAAARRRERLGAAVVRARHHRDDRADGRELHRRQPDPGDHDRLARAAARLAAEPLQPAGRPGAQGGRADADAGRDHRGRRDAVQLRPAPRRRRGLPGDAEPVQHRRRRRSASRWRWSPRTRSGCSGPSSRRWSSRCCCWPAYCSRSRAPRAGCRPRPTSTR